MIALALSGGGSRAIAFHLGCLRALNDRGILPRVSVISAVSGGSVIAGIYAYLSDGFVDFERQVVRLLQVGLQRSAVRHLFSPKLAFLILTANMIARPVGVIARLLGRKPPLRCWASRTDAFEAALHRLWRDIRIHEVKRPGLDVVLNACELRTGTAFRFGNHRSGSWRFGEILNNEVDVAHAIACSAAYPLFLPPFDRECNFMMRGKISRERVILTDGGIYDNLGVSCIEPGRDSSYTLHAYTPDHIICCYAGYGQFSGANIPIGFYSRVEAAFGTNFRKAQDASLHRLHMLKATGSIKGFILPYLGQQDWALPLKPPDLVARDEILEYPTNFAAMDDAAIDRLSRRGEQLTHILLSHYCPSL